MLAAYYKALKPERTYANVMTTVAGFLFASHWHGRWALLVWTIIGTTLIVMSACAVNNVTDRSIDARMPRTQNRGTVTGLVPPSQLTYLAILLGIAGFWILIARVNWLTAILGVIAYVDYVVLYAWSKRTTPWSTLIGTVSGSVPLVAGYTAVTDRFDTTALLLGLIMLFWQMVHFYAIAIFRRDDYAAGGLPVWSVRYGVRNTQRWMIFYTLLYLLAVIQLSLFASAGWLFAVIIGLLSIYWLFVGLKGFNHLDPSKWARSMFGFSLLILLVLSAVVTISPVLF